MPELPEVETTRRGVSPLVSGQTLSGFNIRERRLRWPVTIPDTLVGQTLHGIRRRAKYLLFDFESGSLIIHLGMSGNLRVLPPETAYLKHDHVELLFSRGTALRLNDPRRFGSVHWQPGDALDHWLLTRLGIEPFDESFTGDYLKRLARKKRVAVKNFIMNAQVVVGVGNIYANEALFMAGIRPSVQASRVTRDAYGVLAESIRQVLAEAITMGGTTLRDFVNQNGNPGYFKQSLRVYGRQGQPCHACGKAVSMVRLGNRATFFCIKCQRAQGFVPPEC